MNYNNAINPKADTYPVEVMPGRSAKIKKVTPQVEAGCIGGSTNTDTGEVWIPTGNTARERTIRYHEALHAEFTPKKAVPRDILDQALEDGRLHRHCSKSAHSRFYQARRDELAMALTELRQINKQPIITPINNVVLFRALAILSASSIKDSHVRLLDKAFSRRGKDARAKFDKALALLVDISQWDKARRVLASYFTDSMAGGTSPSPKPTMPDKGRDKDTESKPESTPADSDEDGDSEDESESDSDTGSEDETDGDSEDGEETESESPVSGKIAPALDTKSTRTKPVHPDKYTADLTPECDKDNYAHLSGRFPLDLLIRRLDMGINRVRLSLGRKAPLPVTSGRQILAHKLAGITCNPTMRVFTRPVNQGGYGTILIDASGSMAIPENVLIGFLDKAPALTLAFYNAPNDGYKIQQHGNIYIYAANGYRASLPRVYDAPQYGSGNLIDYQAMAWLIKQPAPHYLVTDQQWTGPWTEACVVLCRKLQASGQLIVVRDLAKMEALLDAKQGRG